MGKQFSETALADATALEDEPTGNPLGFQLAAFRGSQESRSQPTKSSAPSSTTVEAVVLGRETRFRRALGLADAFATAIALLVATLLVGGDSLTPVAFAVPLLVVLMAKSMGLYDRDAHLLHKTTLEEVPSLFGLATLVILLMWLADGVLVDGSIGRAQVVANWGLLLGGLITFRAIARSTARATTATERCLFIGDEAAAEQVREKLATSRAVKAELVGWLPATGDDEEEVERIRVLAERFLVHRVILGPGSGTSEEILDAVRRAKESGLRVSVLPNIARIVNSPADLDRLNGLTLLGVREFELTLSSRTIKRAFDVGGSAIALVCVAPLLPIIAIAVKLDSKGPVLFRGVRAGRDGQPFGMLKFRSMIDGADEMRQSLRHLTDGEERTFKIENDPRLTRVGRVIRRSHLDELPQLWNVVMGEMSLVGPRPLPLEEDRQIEGWHRRRLDIRPGITGPWQILGSSRIPVYEMVRLDYQYIAGWSLWTDVKILLLTMGHVARRGGV